MSDKLYGYALSNAYDCLNDDIDYSAWADFIQDCITRFSDIPVSQICETACGTGSMACELARRGYGVTASDISEDMLCAAENKARESGLSIRFVCQDMRHTKMYSQKDLLLCMLDSMNYLTTPADISLALESGFESLKNGGIFVFDMNSKYKFESIYANNSYILESDSFYCGWENNYNPKSKICDFYLSIFMRRPDGSYLRSDEAQRERMYTIRQTKTLIEKAGFTLCGIFGDFDFTPADENCHERLFYVLKKEVK